MSQQVHQNGYVTVNASDHNVKSSWIVLFVFTTYLVYLTLLSLLLWNGGGERNGTQLQYSCLENPMYGGAW